MRICKILLILLVTGLIFAVCIYFFARTTTALPTYFSYSETDKTHLNNLDSNQVITEETLSKWDSIMFNLVKENKLGDAPASRVYAYVYTAQRDAAFLSKNIKHSFMGSIDPITAKTLCLFFQSHCADLITQAKNSVDAYSEALADIVLKKLESRIEADKKNTHLYSEKPANHYWAGTRPYFGQDVGSWMPWKITSVNDFVAPPPPAYDSPEWIHQVKMTKEALINITDEQKKLVVFWAGNPGTVTPPGLWLIDANNYMYAQKTPLIDMLLIRSTLAMGMADAVIAVFNSKYTYWMKRPFMLDPTINTIMPTPNHPTYPAGHSTISAAAKTILIYFFPENRAYWQEKATQASMGRVWGGIHFTIDAEQGTILGDKVGTASVNKGKN